MREIICVFAAFLAFLVSGCGRTGTSSLGPASVPGPVDFSTEIKPLLESNCLPCHHSETLMGGLSIESRASAFRKSDRGTYLVPGDPEASLIYSMTGQRHGKQEEVMPADGVLLTDKQRELLRRWIEEGAQWPEGKEGVLTPLKVLPGGV